MYKLSNVSKEFRRGDRRVEAIRPMDAQIEDGEWLAIQGPTGQGKSTLLNLLGALDRPTRGTVEFDGTNLTALGEARLTRIRAAEIGFVFQAFNLIPTLTAQENVETALVPLKVAAAARRERAFRALRSVGLAERARHLPGELSGGEQQRVGIARALVKEPRVLLADEPTGNLDEDTRDEIIALLEESWRERGLTLILVTHDSTVAKRAQHRAVMRKGRLVRQPGTGAAARPIADAPPPGSGKTTGGGGTTGGGKTTAPEIADEPPPDN